MLHTYTRALLHYINTNKKLWNRGLPRNLPWSARGPQGISDNHYRCLVYAIMLGLQIKISLDNIFSLFQMKIR